MDRTVHLSEQAVDLPGQARTDMAIWIDYARRMGLADQDGRPLPPWDEPEEAFEAWKQCSAGRPVDYTGLIMPCCTTAAESNGRAASTHRRAPNACMSTRFPTSPDRCESYGHDLAAGAAVTETQFQARRPDGRARSSKPPPTNLPTSCPTPSIPCG